MLSSFTLLSTAAAVVQMDFSIRNSRNAIELTPAHHSIMKRSVNASSNDTVEPVVNASLTSSYNFYHGKILVGQPAQEIDVLLDTGSPITWVYGPESSFQNSTRFFPNQSHTFHDANYSLSAAYGSGQYLGYWGSDLVAAPQFVSGDVTYNSTNSTDNSTSSGSESSKKGLSVNETEYSVPFKFGVVTDFATTAGAPGLLGLGPHIDSAGPKNYLSLPEAYAKNNITSSTAFSVFLEEEEGRFLFGGVDLRYAQLPLYRFHKKKPLSDSPQSTVSSSSWEISLDTIKLNDSEPYIVRNSLTLDTGSPISLLPPGFVDAVGKSFNLTKYGRYETYYTNGTTDHIHGNLTFDFNGLKIEADIRDFLVPGDYIWIDDGPQNATALALMASPNYLLGDAFFRNVYTVLDPTSGDVILGRRTPKMLNASNSTNASTVVSFDKLEKNGSAVLNASSLASSSATTTDVTTTSIEYVTVRTPKGVLANQYLGSVNKADSPTGGSGSGSAAGSSATSTSTSTSGSSSSSSSNFASITAPAFSLLLLAVPAVFLL